MSEYKEWKNHKGPLLDTVNNFDVIECATCGFKHVIPIPSPEELDSIYRKDYYTKEKPDYLKKATEDLDWWNEDYSQRYDTFEKHLSADQRKVLDIGSGPGYFLLHGKRRGWDTLGVEPSKQASEHSQSLGLEIIEEFLTENLKNRLGKFNVVHMHNVLEHLPDPRDMIRICGQMLDPGGIICIISPNDYNPFQKALVTACDYKPWWVGPPHHINFFDFKSLNRLLERSGFNVLLKEATFPIDMFLHS